MLDAMQALRQRNAPDEADTLLARYLADQPHGALVEEALALRIEVAIARGEDVEPRAREYLRRYPEGRFREDAARLLAGAD